MPTGIDHANNSSSKNNTDNHHRIHFSMEKNQRNTNTVIKDGKTLLNRPQADIEAADPTITNLCCIHCLSLRFVH